MQVKNENKKNNEFAPLGKSRFGTFILAPALLILLAVVDSDAQWSGALGSSWNNPTSASISRILIDRMNQRMLEKRLTGKRTATPAKPDGSEVSTPISTAEINASARFKSTGVRLKVPSIVKELGGTPAEQEQMTVMLTGILDAWDKETAVKGMKNDLAFAFAGFVAMSASAYREAELPSEEKVLELRNMMAEALATGGAMKGVSDKQKQEMYEVLAIFGTLAYGGWQQSIQNGDRASATVYKQLAQKNLETVLGVDPDSISFSSEGLVLKGAASEAQSESTPAAMPGSAAGGAIPVGELVGEYEANEVGANLKYGGKRVSIYGNVNSVDIENDGRIALTFRSSINSYGNAKCYFNKSQSAALARLKTNDQVTVAGTVKGYGGGWGGAKAYIILEDCMLQ